MSDAWLLSKAQYHDLDVNYSHDTQPEKQAEDLIEKFTLQWKIC